MPAESRAQQQAMAIAEHNPEKLHAKNRGMLKMSKSQLHDFASTGGELPHHARKGAPMKVKPSHGPMKGGC